MDVSLYEGQECVNRVKEQAGTNVDIKFGLTINPQLADGILVSVIASDFTEEFDFTSTPTFQTPLDRSQVGNGVDAVKKDNFEQSLLEERESGEEDASEIGDSILPNFLKNGI